MRNLLASALARTLRLPAWAQPAPGASALEWMARKTSESRRFEYQGVMIYAHDGRIDSMRVSRSLGPSGPRDEIVALNGDQRVLVREDGHLTFSDPKGAKLDVAVGEFPLLARDPAEFGAAAAQYRVTLAGRDRVAGLDSTVLDANPSDQSRYGYRLWVEPSSGMLLGSNLEGPDGQTVQQLMFTSIALSPRASLPKLAPPSSTSKDLIGKVVGDPGWKVSWLPAGFRLIGTPTHPTGQTHLLYSDGLAYVSVYIEPFHEGAAPMNGNVRRGAVNLYAQPVGDRQVVVIGDVPATTAERIARAVEQAKPPH